MAGPGDEMAAGRGHLRASNADREQVISLLKPAFVQGRLTKDEFDLRVGRALLSRTCAELAALTADIPADLVGVQPLQPAREWSEKKAAAAVLGTIAAWWGHRSRRVVLGAGQRACSGIAGRGYRVRLAACVDSLGPADRRMA